MGHLNLPEQFSLAYFLCSLGQEEQTLNKGSSLFNYLLKFKTQPKVTGFFPSVISFFQLNSIQILSMCPRC